MLQAKKEMKGGYKSMRREERGLRGLRGNTNILLFPPFNLCSPPFSMLINYLPRLEISYPKKNMRGLLMKACGIFLTCNTLSMILGM
jgi:hypothetical protein